MAKAARRDEPIEALLKEDRKFPPPKAFAARALATIDRSALVMRQLGRLPTSIDNMTPGNPFIQTLGSLPVAEGIASNSIIAVKGDGPFEDGSDGVVRYRSAHLKGVDSELVVRSSHSAQGLAETIEEIRRILVEHAAAE